MRRMVWKGNIDVLHTKLMNDKKEIGPGLIPYLLAIPHNLKNFARRYNVPVLFCFRPGINFRHCSKEPMHQKGMMTEAKRNSKISFWKVQPLSSTRFHYLAGAPTWGKQASAKMSTRVDTHRPSNRRRLGIWQYIAIDARPSPCCQAQPSWDGTAEIELGKFTTRLSSTQWSADKWISEPPAALLFKEMLFLESGEVGSDMILMGI